MGLPSLQLNADHVSRWRTILEENGLSVRQDESVGEQSGWDAPTKRVSESLWLVGDGIAEVAILQAIYQDQPKGRVFLIFMPTRTRVDRPLVLLVQKVLIESGAAQGRETNGP